MRTGAIHLSAQHLYNLVSRDVEREILPACDDQGLGMICWSPLAGGLLTGKFQGKNMPETKTRLGKEERFQNWFWFDEARALVDVLVDTAKKLGKTPAQVAMAWLLHDERIAAPIVGARSLKQIEENLEANDFDLPEDVWKTLTDAMPLKHGYPKDWMDTTFPNTFNKMELKPRHYQRLP